MIRTFTYRGIEATILIDEGGKRGDWYLEYTLPDGLLQRYICGWPRPARPIIQVPFTKVLLRPLTGEVLKSEPSFFIEPRLEFFYDTVAVANRGLDIAVNAICGLVASLPEFGGNPANLAQGHRVLNDDLSLRQPVVYDLTTSPETSTEGTPQGDGMIAVGLLDHDASGPNPITYQIKGAADADFSPTQETPNFEGLAAGTYTIRVTDTVGTYRDEIAQVLPAEVLE